MCVCGRSVFRGRVQADGALAAGSVREPTANIFVTTGRRAECVEIGGVAAQLEALATAARGLARVGLEAADITWARQRRFGAEVFTDAELVPTEGVVEGFRRVKDPGELARMEAAADIADAALAQVLSERLGHA